MTTDEKLAIAVEALRRLANKEAMDKASASMSRFGSAGAALAYQDVQQCAEDALARMAGAVLVPVTWVPGVGFVDTPADGLCAAETGGHKCNLPFMHAGDWHSAGGGVVWPVVR